MRQVTQSASKRMPKSLELTFRFSGPEAQERKSKLPRQRDQGSKAIPQFLKALFLPNSIDSGEDQEFIIFPVFTLYSWQSVVVPPLSLLRPDQASPPEDKSEENLDRDPPSGAWVFE